MSADDAILDRAKFCNAPDSRGHMSTNTEVRVRKAFAMARRKAARSTWVRLVHDPWSKADLAESTAPATSGSDASATRRKISSSFESVTSNIRALEGARHLPAM